MDFDLSEEQRLLGDSLGKLLADRYGFEARKGYMTAPDGWSRDAWAAYAELGILGLPFAEADGGFGGSPVETMIVAEALGGALALEPWLATVVLGGGLLRHGADAALRAELVPQVADGSLLLALGHTEPQSRHDLHDVATTAKRDGDAWVLNGRKGVVLHGDVAGKLFVTARTAGSQRDRSGIGIFLVSGDAHNLTRRGYRTTDGLRAAEITLDGVRAEAAIGDPADGLPLLERVVAEAIAALAAEAVGAMDATLKLTLEYLRTRKQFGRAIGTFQALQHRAADMMVAIEQARSMAMYAAMMVQEDDATERNRAIHAVKTQIGRMARIVGQHSIQLHGGIGMTMEYAVGHYFKRLTAIDTLFGDADHHLDALSEAGGLVEAA
jgi:pimeloyl-CoA dehydrogenase small subunit